MSGLAFKRLAPRYLADKTRLVTEYSDKLSDYGFDLPEELIAQAPAQKRDESRLLLVRRYPDKGQPFFEDLTFKDLPFILRENDLDDACFFRNRSAVLPARFYATRSSGSKHEFVLLEEVDGKPGQWKCIIRNSAKLNFPEAMNFEGADERFEVLDASTVDFSKLSKPLKEVLADVGEMPLPPYIKDRDNKRDTERYQSIWAEKNEQKSIAAPTASLHFTDGLIKELLNEGHSFADCMLHVGLGTFEPMRSDKISEHKMHSERYSISKESQQQLCSAIDSFQPIIPVGSTALRTLESLTLPPDSFEDISSRTDLFIKDDFEFKYADALITNFHLPESSLFVMMSSFAGGTDLAQEAYKWAIKKKYRFFSYGDATLWI